MRTYSAFGPTPQTGRVARFRADAMRKALARAGRSQVRGGVAAVVDCGGRLTVDMMRAYGVRPHELLVSQPDNSEQAREIAETLKRSGAVDFIALVGCPRRGR